MTKSTNDVQHKLHDCLEIQNDPSKRGISDSYKVRLLKLLNQAETQDQ